MISMFLTQVRNASTPQYERKIINAITSAPFVLSSVKGLRPLFSNLSKARQSAFCAFACSFIITELFNRLPADADRESQEQTAPR